MIVTAPLAHRRFPPWIVTGGRRWPVVEGITFARAGREALADEVLSSLEAGDDRLALALLLTDTDDWAPGPAPSVDEAAGVVDDVAAGATLRHAMSGLGFGPVADYFAYRWSDPTFLSGLALLEAAWPSIAPDRAPQVVELACGIGHLLAAASSAGASVIGCDVVFAKLWLARRFVVPTATLHCLDAGRQRLPIDDGGADLAVVHDALYFFEDDAKRAVAAEARRVAPAVAVGHVHNALVDNWSAGRPLDPAQWAALLPGGQCFDDLELTAAWLERRRPRSRPVGELAGAAAIAVVDVADHGQPARPLGEPPARRPLRLNPLFVTGAGDPVPLTLCWPSDRYRDEYASLSAHLDVASIPQRVLDAACAGAVDDPSVADLVRRRVVLDLPERW